MHRPAVRLVFRGGWAGKVCRVPAQTGFKLPGEEALTAILHCSAHLFCVSVGDPTWNTFRGSQRLTVTDDFWRWLWLSF